MHQRDPFQDDVDFQFGALITVLCPRPVGDDVIPSAAADARFGPAADAASFSPPYTGPSCPPGWSALKRRAPSPRDVSAARAPIKRPFSSSGPTGAPLGAPPLSAP